MGEQSAAVMAQLDELERLLAAGTSGVWFADDLTDWLIQSRDGAETIDVEVLDGAWNNVEDRELAIAAVNALPALLALARATLNPTPSSYEGGAQAEGVA